jgi:hypothetical protein
MAESGSESLIQDQVCLSIKATSTRLFWGFSYISCHFTHATDGVVVGLEAEL